MSNQADKSMADLKEITGQLLAIVRTARQIPPGPSHFALVTHASELVARAVQDHGKSACLPRLVLSCSRELIQTRNCSPQEAPNWRSIGHDDPRLMWHSWHSKALTWQALGDHLFDLAHKVDGSATDNAPGPSTSVDGDALEKGKGKAREVELEPEKEKEMEKPKEEQEKPCRKRPFSQMSKPLPKSAMKTPKRGMSGQEWKSRELVDSSDEEEEEDGLSKPRSDTSSVIVTRRVSTAQPSRPSGPPRSPGSPKKGPFGPGMTPRLMRPDVPESSQVTSESPRDVPPVVDARAILMPRPNNPCRCCTQYELPCTTRFDKRKGTALMSCVLCMTKKVKCISARLGTLAATTVPGPKQAHRLGDNAHPPCSRHCIIEFGCPPCSPGLPDPGPPLDVDREEGSTTVAPVTEPTHPPSQTEAALDPATAIESTVPVDAVHSPADDGASTFTSAFTLPAPPAMNPTPLETPEDGPSTSEIVECGLPLNLLPEYDSGDEQDAVMEIVLSNQYSIPTIVQTSEPRACSKESQGPSPEHIGAQHSVFAFWLSILGPPTLIPDVRRSSVLSPQLSVLGPWYLILGAWAAIPNPWYSVLNSQYSPPRSQFAILDPWYSVRRSLSSTLVFGSWYSIGHTRYSVLRSRYSILWYLILNARVAIPDPQYSVLGTRCSVCHT
ncbi:uncharacterized protein EDB91DRAFT_1082108 [Suillus paluster]|uniref:uncharacterized protein n=1 Tax=Suillus paluster TaxID=48578 RepID=UPI001B8872FB|nr:uncharacterized protein EDB91DRAFT_1082108 [Suillus paluster]KAG1740130.1 hypothetical protein EDB91DRAFT_1082108 [Suillus paluster]